MMIKIGKIQKLLVVLLRHQIDKFGRIDEIKAYISSLPENQRVFAKEKIFEYVKQECGYIFY